MDETPASSRLHFTVLLHVALHVFGELLQENKKPD